MKKIILLLSTSLMLTATSCDYREDVEGQWQSGIININMPNTTASTASMVMTFSQDGKLSINSDIFFTEPIATTQGDMSHVTVSATATIDGIWQYVKGEDDEVDIIFDNKSLVINISPDDINISTGINQDVDETTIDQLKQTAVINYTMMLTDCMKGYFARFSRLEDIKVTKGEHPSLRFETDMPNSHDEHYIFTPI